MKRAHRLRQSDHFQRARREGRKWDDPLFTLQVVANHRRRTRCGFVVSKKIGIAVVRNRAKRRLREAVRLIYERLAPGWDVVFIIRSPLVGELDFQQLCARVEQQLRRSHIWRDPVSINLGKVTS